MEGNSSIMSLEEIAKYLKIGKSTLYKMAREGKIHVNKVSLSNIKNPLDNIKRHKERRTS